MKVLVTGGVGFIGTNLCERLLREHHDVYSIDNYSIGTEENHVEGVEYFNEDINNIHKLNIKVDLCFHLAGLSLIQPSFKNPLETFKSNTEGTQNVLEFCRKNNIKVVYAGSSSRHHNPYQSPYALYKYLGEEICKMYKETYKMKVEIARFYNVYGPKEVLYGDWAAVIGIWRKQIKEKLPITIVGDGNQRRDFTHVDDIVDGLVRIAFSNKSNSDAWELGSGKNYSINEISKLLVKKFNCDIKYIPDQNGNYRETLRKQNDALEILGWVPQKNIEEYIESL